MSKLEVLIGAQIAQIVGTPDVVDLWVKRTMYPSRASVRMITGARSAHQKIVAYVGHESWPAASHGPPQLSTIADEKS